ncbi:MAG: 50S ribosomal protein L23 [Patescibacteria group bacterium]
MAFSLFRKKQAAPPPKNVSPKKDTLVPIADDQPVKGSEKKAASAQKKTWNQFPLQSESILIHPLLTEKAMQLSASGKYVFEVGRQATKLSIRKAFFNVYGVMPTKIAVIRQDGKEVRYGKHSGRRRHVKKAIITVKKGVSVDIGI